MEIEDFIPLLGLLTAIGIIFGTFVQFQSATPFGFTWFINMLWFAIGFPILTIIAYLVFAIGVKGEKKLSE